MNPGVVGLVVVIALGLLTSPLPVWAQHAPKRIGILSLARTAPGLPHDSFRKGLRELGWIEGQNVVIEFRFAAGRIDRLPGLAAELVRLRVDVIVTNGEPAIRAAKEAAGTTPIVMAVVGDPVAPGFVSSLARPGGNITGLTNLAAGLARKRLELLKEIVPGASRVAVLRYPANRALDPLYWNETSAAAQALGITLQSVELRRVEELDASFAAMKKERADALVVLPDPVFFVYRTRLGELETRHRMPAMHDAGEIVEAGGLVAYGPSISDLFRRAAKYVDRILKGAKPADLPVEQPTKFELVVNLRTAKALGLTIPSTILLRAERVIE